MSHPRWSQTYSRNNRKASRTGRDCPHRESCPLVVRQRQLRIRTPVYPEKTNRKTLLCECVSAYLPVDEEQRRQLETLLRNHPDAGVQAMTMGLLDHVEERGKLKGVQKGQRELLRKQLETRFGRLSPT